MSSYQQWVDLGVGYPGEPVDGDRVARAAFDVLAPVEHRAAMRLPIYEEGHEETPAPLDVWAVALKIAEKVRGLDGDESEGGEGATS